MRASIRLASLFTIPLPQWVKMARATLFSAHQPSWAAIGACPINAWSRRRTIDRTTVAPSPT
jgi:hypothetical protein